MPVTYEVRSFGDTHTDSDRERECVVFIDLTTFPGQPRSIIYNIKGKWVMNIRSWLVESRVLCIIHVTQY